MEPSESSCGADFTHISHHTASGVGRCALALPGCARSSCALRSALSVELWRVWVARTSNERSAPAHGHATRRRGHAPPAPARHPPPGGAAQQPAQPSAYILCPKRITVHC